MPAPPLRLRLYDRRPAPEPLNVGVIAAISRPQSVKKVVRFCATAGVKSLHFVRSANGEKSYLQSKIFQPDRILREVVTGLEQGGGAHPPHVEMHGKFRPFMEDTFPSLQADFPAPWHGFIACLPRSDEQLTRPFFLPEGPAAAALAGHWIRSWME